MGKIVRVLIIFIILALGFILRCELFHMQITNAFYSYYQAFGISVSDKDTDIFKQDIMSTSKENACELFFVYVDYDNKLHKAIYVYGNENKLSKELNRHDIREGKFESLYSGTVEIYFKDITECTNERINETGYLLSTGDEKTNVNIYNNLKNKYEISYPRTYQGNEVDMIIVIWSFIAIMIVMLSLNEILGRKKEILIRCIHGENISKIIISEMFFTFITFQLLYFLTEKIVFHFVSGDYYPYLALLIYEIGCLVSCVLYLSLFKIDIQQVLFNANGEKGYITFLRLLKMIAFAISIFSLATSISNIGKGIFGSSDDIFYKYFKNANFIYMSQSSKTEPQEVLYEDIEAESNTIWEKLYSEELEKIKPVLAMKVAEENGDYILVNDYASPLISMNIDDIVSDGKITVIHHKNASINRDLLNMLIHYYFENEDYNTSTYEKNVRVDYIDSNELSGFSYSKNPIIIYVPNSRIIKPKVLADHQNMIYDIPIQKYKELILKYKMEEEGYKNRITNLGDYIQYKKQFLNKIIKFFSTFSILIILLNTVIISLVIQLEYKKDGLEYAIKKILGYGMLEKNKRQLLNSLIPNIIISIFLCAFGLFTKLYSLKIGVTTSVLLCLIECVIILIMIIKIEKESINKILKGGCL